MIGHNGMLALDSEAKIVWLKDINLYPWAREYFVDYLYPQGMSPSDLNPDEITIGYADLKENSHPEFTDEATGLKHYRRRIFIVRKDDYKEYQDGTFPSEAILTSSISPKNEGIHPKEIQYTYR